jgi:hypothetical protein
MIAAPSAAERDGPPGQAADLRQRGGVQPGLPRTFAEIVRETNVLSQQLSGSGELAGAYGVAGQVNAQVVQAADGGPVVTAAPAPRPGSTQMRSQIQGPRHRDAPELWIASIRSTYDAQIWTARDFIGIQPTPRQIGGYRASTVTGADHCA